RLRLRSACMLPLPPLTPLFPYTTLFRSFIREEDIRSKIRTAIGMPSKRPNFERFFMNIWTNETSAWISARAWAKGQETFAAGDLDRKSTRLNSSHVKISYAVFCLKKKNN